MIFRKCKKPSGYSNVSSSRCLNSASSSSSVVFFAFDFFGGFFCSYCDLSSFSSSFSFSKNLRIQTHKSHRWFTHLRVEQCRKSITNAVFSSCFEAFLTTIFTVYKISQYTSSFLEYEKWVHSHRERFLMKDWLANNGTFGLKNSRLCNTVINY